MKGAGKCCVGPAIIPRFSRRRDYSGRCTIDGILELERQGLRVTLIQGGRESTSRARELL